MNVLFIGDIVGKLGRQTVAKVLPDLITGDNINLVFANCENIAHGRGATERTILETIGYGVNAFSGGDHLFKHKGFETEIENLPVARPLNYFDPCPGRGFVEISVKGLKPVLLVSVMGTAFGGVNTKNAFFELDEFLKKHKKEGYSGIFVDIHGDLTSEKRALGFYLDGRVSAVLGTHTHVPTSDTQVLEKGTAYVTDIGMTGAKNTVLGVNKEVIIEKFKSSLDKKFVWEETGTSVFSSVLVEFDETTGNAIRIERRDREVGG